MDKALVFTWAFGPCNHRLQVRFRVLSVFVVFRFSCLEALFVDMETQFIDRRENRTVHLPGQGCEKKLEDGLQFGWLAQIIGLKLPRGEIISLNLPAPPALRRAVKKPSRESTPHPHAGKS